MPLSTPRSDKSLLIVWHSRTGASEQVALSAARAAASAETDMQIVNLTAAAVDADHMLAAAGYLFVCPENLGTMSGQMKEFFDRNYYPCLEKLNGRPYACIVCAGSDGQGAVRQIERIAAGWRLKAVMDAVILNTDAQTPEQILQPKVLAPSQLAQARDIGAALASGLSMGVF